MQKNILITCYRITSYQTFPCWISLNNKYASLLVIDIIVSDFSLKTNNLYGTHKNELKKLGLVYRYQR